jgi:AcrR family transcriptional regulator
VADLAEFLRKRPTQRRAQTTFDTLLDATAHLLDEIEFEELNTNRIADRAGYSIGTLYKYFPDKQALVRELALREIERGEHSFTTLIDAHDDSEAETLVRALVKAATGMFAGRATLRRRVIGVVGLDPRLHHQMEDVVERITDNLLQAVKVDRAAIQVERRFLILRAILLPIRNATMRAPHLLESPVFEDELVAAMKALLLPAEQ